MRMQASRPPPLSMHRRSTGHPAYRKTRSCLERQTVPTRQVLTYTDACAPNSVTSAERPLVGILRRSLYSPSRCTNHNYRASSKHASRYMGHSDCGRLHPRYHHAASASSNHSWKGHPSGKHRRREWFSLLKRGDGCSQHDTYCECRGANATCCTEECRLERDSGVTI
jgi:hypothetical protein